MTEFKLGDVVRVKGSAVKMTVESVMDGEVKAVWFDTFNHFHRESLTTLILEHVDGNTVDTPDTSDSGLTANSNLSYVCRSLKRPSK
jgi:uncharacterized protein YodC (DUF2158 family)